MSWLGDDMAGIGASNQLHGQVGGATIELTLCAQQRPLAGASPGGKVLRPTDQQRHTAGQRSKPEIDKFGKETAAVRLRDGEQMQRPAWLEHGDRCRDCLSESVS